MKAESGPEKMGGTEGMTGTEAAKGAEGTTGTETAKGAEKMTGSLLENMRYMNAYLGTGKNFDVLYREVEIGKKRACLYMIDGFCKDEVIQKLLQHFMGITAEKMPGDADGMSRQLVPYGEVDLEDGWKRITYAVMSGVVALFIDGYEACILIDARTYPARDVSEPEKDKVLRGSKDGFVETVVYNTALIRRRIRSPQLRMEMLKAGDSSQTDIVLCYMEDRVDLAFLNRIKTRIETLRVDALTLNQESLAECLYQRRWFNPFPKFKYTERPDTAAAQVLEGNIVLLVDNSPSAMITPTSFFDVAEEADDYYFPPVTGTYLRLSRMLIAVLTYFLTPTYLLLMRYPQWIPEGLAFIMVKEEVHIALIWQFLLLELAIDGLKLAAVNTPNMLSTPLSVMAALVLGEFSVKSGWFNAEVMLYMAFVAVANYTQNSYELGYALKFMRILNLILTAAFGLWGYIAAVLILFFSIASNRTISDQSYLYPLIPFNAKQLAHQVFRTRLPEAKR